MSDKNISIETDQWRSLDDGEVDSKSSAIPTASAEIDRLFFPIFHGVPKKCITEIVGLPGTGKTCFA